MNKGYNDILPGYFYSGTRKRAILSGHEWNIDYQYLCDLWKTQDGLCALTFANNKKDYIKHRNTTASLDRIDSSKEYDFDNLQWVHKNINRLKNDLSQEEFFSLCHEVVKWKQKDVLSQVRQDI